MFVRGRNGLTVLALAVAACTAGSPTPPASMSVSIGAVASQSPISSSAVPTSTAAPSTSPSPSGPFRSVVYGYAVTSPAWTGTASTTAWDGTGDPGNGDGFVDTLIGPIPNTFAFGERTNATLNQFAAARRAASAKGHPCPGGQITTTKLNVGGVPALLDSGNCGVFVLTAYVVRAVRAYAFVMFDNPGTETADRAAFEGLLKAVSFDP